MKNPFKKLIENFNSRSLVAKASKEPMYANDNDVAVAESEDEIIAKIHKEFDDAEDNILSAADKLLEELKIPTESDLEQRAKALIAIGFENAETVKKYENLQVENIRIQEDFTIAKGRAKLIREYKQEYPFQKFLTEMELNRICDKYGLIYAPVSAYIKDVPEKNLNEIKNAKVLSDDLKVDQQYVLEITKFYDDIPKAIKEFLLDGGIELQNGSVLKSMSVFGTGRLNQINDVIKQFMLTSGFKNKDIPAKIIEECDIKTLNKQGLFIAAPPSNFKLDDLKNKGKHGYFEVTSSIKIDRDPIVFRYCKGGIQVLSKWGLEASEPTLVNEVLN